MGALDQFGTRLAENLGITSQLDALRQQHPTPTYQVRVDGNDVSGTLRPRLMHMTITDNRGFSADTIEIALDDSDGKLAMPRHGATLQASIGWQGGALVDKGTFKIDEVEHGGAPDVLTIRGKSADLRGGMNKLRERSWHFETIGAIVDQLAARYDLTPSVGETFKGMMIDHIDQTNESDLAFLTRLATEQDAIATVKSGRLMFIKAGNGTTASGKPLPAITITRQDGDQHQFSVADRDAYTGVTAYWQDNKAAEKKKIEVKRSGRPNRKRNDHYHREWWSTRRSTSCWLATVRTSRNCATFTPARATPCGQPELSGESCSAAWLSFRSPWPKVAPNSTRNNPQRSGASNHKSTRPTGYSPRWCTTSPLRATTTACNSK